MYVRYPCNPQLPTQRVRKILDIRRPPPPSPSARTLARALSAAPTVRRPESSFNNPLCTPPCGLTPNPPTSESEKFWTYDPPPSPPGRLLSAASTRPLSSQRPSPGPLSSRRASSEALSSRRPSLGALSSRHPSPGLLSARRTLAPPLPLALSTSSPSPARSRGSRSPSPSTSIRNSPSTSFRNRSPEPSMGLRSPLPSMGLRNRSPEPNIRAPARSTPKHRA